MDVEATVLGLNGPVLMVVEPPIYNVLENVDECPMEC